MQRARVVSKSGPMFVPLRDRTGTSQLVVLKDHDLRATLENLPAESVVEVVGTVQRRPDRDINNEMPTGDIEIRIESLDVHNKTELLPFSVTDKSSDDPTKENLRLAHRYLDLRRSEVMTNIILRSKVSAAMRRFLLDKHGFVEVETPTLFKRTPEGAREFLVPTRTSGRFYSLVQSPQQFKQMLMVGGVDRYFQLARCYRDEDLRADRQPEFTQLDLEMSFIDENGIMNLIENLTKFISSEINIERKMNPPPFPRLPYKEAMEKYGSDKPDTRYEMSIQQRQIVIEGQQWTVRAFCVPEGKTVLGEHERGVLTSAVMGSHQSELTMTWSAHGLLLAPQSEPWGEVNLADVIQTLCEEVGGNSEDFVVGYATCTSEEQMKTYSYSWNRMLTTLGKIRTASADILNEHGGQLYDPNLLQYTWIVDFPLFLPADKSGTLESAHHPFTAPRPEDLHLLYSSPEKVIGQHYDLVLNGVELGGGSIRIHQADMQERIVREILGRDPEPLAHLLNALAAGCPPHGGIALGLDRYMAVLCNAKSLRDVIAFPKSFKGQDLLTGAPSNVPQSELDMYHITVTD